MTTLRLHTIATPNHILLEDLTGVQSDYGVLKPYYAELRRLCLEHNGVGISANQVGLRENFFFLMPGAKIPVASTGQSVAHICVNPTWEGSDGPDNETSGTEGCLSLPGRLFLVPRRTVIRATWTNAVGHRVTKRLVGWPARVFQHEYDHLRGITLLQSGKEVKA